MDETVSSLQIKSNFRAFKASLLRFNVSAEQFFLLLVLRNSRLENFVDEEVK